MSRNRTVDLRSVVPFLMSLGPAEAGLIHINLLTKMGELSIPVQPGASKPYRPVKPTQSTGSVWSILLFIDNAAANNWRSLQAMEDAFRDHLADVSSSQTSSSSVTSSSSSSTSSSTTVS